MAQRHPPPENSLTWLLGTLEDVCVCVCVCAEMRLNVGRNMERAGDRWGLKYEAGPIWTLLTHNSNVSSRALEQIPHISFLIDDT